MNSPEVLISAILIGPPSFLVLLALMRGWWMKGREFRIQEKRIQMEERLRSDELGARILRSDDASSSVQFATLAEEMRQLREEIAQLRREMNGRIVG